MDHPQPTLRDGDLVLRPWDPADAAESVGLQDPELSRWPDLPAPGATVQEHSAWVREKHAEWADSRSTATFLVEWQGQVAGSVEVRRVREGVGSLSWLVYAPYRRRGIASRAVRLLVEFAFGDLGLGRVEARVNPLNRPALGVALRAGLRREGLLRSDVQVGDETHDTVLLGRLTDDPAPGSREGFTAMLDSALPVKRAIAQGVLRNETGDVLLCELAYKSEWDLPGGVVDPGESPATCVVREVQEELGLVVTPQRLLAVNWMPPWLGWRDAVLLVFDLGTVRSDIVDELVLEDREIRAVHWAPESVWTAKVAPYTVRMLRSLASRSSDEAGAIPYLEDGLPRLEGHGET